MDIIPPDTAAPGQTGHVAAHNNISDVLTEMSGQIQALTGGDGGGGGTVVTSASVVSANGFAGTVATATTTPAITLSTTVTGVLKGNGTAVSAAASGTDYAPATSGTALLKGSGSGGFSSATAGTDYLAPSGSGAQLTGITATQVGADAAGLASQAQASAQAYAAGLQPTSGSPLARSVGGTGVSESTAAALVEALGALLAASNLSDVQSAATALANLGGLPLAGGTLTGPLLIQMAYAALSVVNTDGTQYAQASLNFYNTAATLGSQGGMQIAAGIADAGATQGYVAIQQLDHTGAIVQHLLFFDLSAQTAELYFPLSMNGQKITNGAAGAASTDFATVGQLPTLASLGAAPLASPALTGSPTAPTQTTGDNSTKIATDAFVAAATSAATAYFTRVFAV